MTFRTDGPGEGRLESGKVLARAKSGEQEGRAFILSSTSTDEETPNQKSETDRNGLSSPLQGCLARDRQVRLSGV